MSKNRQNIVVMDVEYYITNIMSKKPTIQTCQQETCDRKSITGFPICKQCLQHHVKRRYEDNLIYLDIHTTGIDLCIIITTMREHGCMITYYNDKFGLQNITKPKYNIKSIRMSNGRHRDATPDEESLAKLLISPSK